MARRLTDSEREQSAQIVALFSVLIHAWQTGNLPEAESVRQDLLELGVQVEIPQRSTTEGGER